MTDCHPDPAIPVFFAIPDRAKVLNKIASLVLTALASIVVAVTIPGCGSSDSSTPAVSPRASQTDDPAAIVDPTDKSAADQDAEPKRLDDSVDTPSMDREVKIANADAFVSQGDFAGAETELQKLLVADPTDAEILFRLANVAALAGDLPKAIELLAEIPPEHPQAGLPALGQSADWCFQLKRYDEAARHYEKVLTLVPQAAQALRQLAYLRNRQGRRHEAAEYVHELCKLGDVRQDELHSLMALSDAMYDDPSTAETLQAGERPYWPIGASGQARKSFDDKQYADVIALLEDSVADGTAAPTVVALYGLATAEAQDNERFLQWYSQADDQVQQCAEYWAAVGAYLIDQRKFNQAIRALAEAIQRDPTDVQSLGRIRYAFLAIKDDQTANRFIQRWVQIWETLRVNNIVAATKIPDPDSIAELASALEVIDRRLEAVLWRALEQHYRNSPASERTKLGNLQRQLVSDGQMFASPASRWCGLDLTKYALPDIKGVASSDGPAKFASGPPSDSAITPASLANIAQAVGLKHQYAVAKDPVKIGFAVYQMLGGGVAVSDYDLDGNVDLYLAQGGCDPPEFKGDQTDQLYRNVDGLLVDATQSADASDFAYTIGVTSGDWNQDGFSDLVINNIGSSELLINNGDGTFNRRSMGAVDHLNRVPSSVAMADLTDDGLPDIYQANYVDDPQMLLKPETDESGKPLSPILPSKYRPGPDQLIVNDGAGGSNERRWSADLSHDSTTLGVIIADFDGQPGAEVFTANDMYANCLWRRTAEGKWDNEALVRGCAFSYSGAATAAMGVAASDFQNNGTIDIHVTNFAGENVSLYLNNQGTFQDRSILYQLGKDSHDMLGFGTQAIDYDNNGLRDLAVTNGHIDDAVSNTSPFEQLPQLFRNLGGRFEIAEVDDASDYWSSTHLGRTMAKLDFNRDGKNDLVVTHIEQPTALLLNQTPTKNHWLQLQLVGTKSERDSTGARIRLRGGGQEWTDWVIAGDGYLCHNEDAVCFGVGENTVLDEVVVDWPSGTRQVFSSISVDRRILIVEGDETVFTLFESK
ncbi:FG-GAP-like repeat-containing protein [Stieleria marina]|uniref:FG-GAP-like repeat-containing protein n=1 Tax=Stieleria marina TaxID=1930275 RepID=UPI003AF40443